MNGRKTTFIELRNYTEYIEEKETEKEKEKGKDTFQFPTHSIQLQNL